MLPDANPIARDTGLALRWFPVTDTSRIVVWFTLEHGKLSTLIRGSQRPKSWMLGQFDLFYTCEVLFYTRAREDLHLLRECSPLTPRAPFRTNWKACAAASFVADLLYRIPPPGAAAPDLYRLAERTLDLMSTAPVSPVLMFWFELQLYRRLGIEPGISDAPNGPFHFDYRQGRIGSRPVDGESAPVREGTKAILQHLLAADQPEPALRLRLLPAQTREIAGHLDRFSQWHLDRTLDSRHHALSWIA